MVIGEDMPDGLHNNHSPAPVSPPHDEGVSQVSLEMMESVIQRLQPSDRHEIREMITQRGWIAGAMATMAALLWWIAVQKNGEKLGDVDIPASMIGGFEFAELSLIVPAITLFATVVMSIGREKGHGILSTLAGVLVILGLFYILEPFGYLIFGDFSTQTVLLASGRLVALSVLLHFSARFFFDAILLMWVREWILSNDIDLFPAQPSPSYEGQADEQPPLG